MPGRDASPGRDRATLVAVTALGVELNAGMLSRPDAIRMALKHAQDLLAAEVILWASDEPTSIAFHVPGADALPAFSQLRDAEAAVRAVARLGVAQMIGPPGEASRLLVPVTTPDGVAGVLDVTAPEDRPTLDVSDLAACMAVAERLGSALTTRRFMDALREKADLDQLTGLPNRSVLVPHLESVLAAQPQHEGGIAVIFVDIDRFKDVNDTLGHAVGDQVIRAVGARIRDQVRVGDVVVRFGGDEFVIVAHGFSHDDELTAMLDRVTRIPDVPMRLGSDRLYVAVSAGVARQREGDDAETMLRHADAAMYRAKNAVARRWAEYTEPMHDASVNQLRRDGELVEAISGGQLFCEFQPIVDARTGEMLAHEALVRWHHPALGRIEPGGFVSASERTGLIVPLSAWVLDESLRRSAEWPEDVAVSVNLSARQFADPSLADRVLAALERAGAAPSRLIVEVTETVMMSEPDIAAQCLRSLHSAGVRIAFDDFGTGYTSITDVQRLPIDLLKMDRGFVSATRTEQGRDLLGALYSLASALGVATIAEGVETPEELRLVQDLGGTYVQGFLLGRPVPAESVAHHHVGVGTFGDGRAVTPERAS